MSKNILPEIAKMLDVEMYEKFKIECMSSDLVFRIGVDGLEMERFDYAEDDRIWVNLASCNFVDLLTGKAKIVKLPWKPKAGEQYYSFGGRFLGDPTVWIVVDVIWQGLAYDVAMFDKGWVYRTRAEAESALPAVAKEMNVEYEIGRNS